MTGPARYLRWPEVHARYGFSRSTAWRLIKAGRFPGPIHLTATRSTFWRSTDLDAFDRATGEAWAPAEVRP